MAQEKRSLSLHGHRTSVALEPEFWAVIDKELQKSNMSFAGFIAERDDQRVMEKSPYGLATYLRVWVIKVLTQNSAG